MNKAHKNDHQGTEHVRSYSQHNIVFNTLVNSHNTYNGVPFSLSFALTHLFMTLIYLFISSMSLIDRDDCCSSKEYCGVIGKFALEVIARISLLLLMIQWEWYRHLLEIAFSYSHKTG